MAISEIHEAKAHFSELIEKALLGEEVIIARGSQPVVRLTPVRLSARRKVGSAKNQFSMTADFYELLPEFDD